MPSTKLHNMNAQDTIKILGIHFHNGSVEDVIFKIKTGGLLTVPAAPGLVNIKKDPIYYKALQSSSYVIADSGYMALIWNLMYKKKVNRISGLKFLIAFLNDLEVQQHENILLVDPRPAEAVANLNYLNNNGFKLDSGSSYVAPLYSKGHVEDEELLRLIEERKPRFVIINLAGGVQEKLGAYLNSNLSYKPGIICTGAAIAFLTGYQADIPNWADRLYLGWLCRCIEKPDLYIPRYLSSFSLLGLMLRHRANAAA